MWLMVIFFIDVYTYGLKTQRVHYMQIPIKTFINFLAHLVESREFMVSVCLYVTVLFRVDGLLRFA